MTTELLKTKIAEKLELLPESELQTVLSFVDYLAWRIIDRVQIEPTTQIDSQPAKEDIVDSQLESVCGVLVLKAAIEPANQQILNTALQDSREARINQLMSW